MRKILLWLFSHRFLAIGRWDMHFLVLRLRNTVTRQRTRIAGFIASRRPPRYLNLGSGPRGLDDAHWLNVDGFTDKNVHFLIDISRALPFPSETFEGVFCEHVLEHFSVNDGLKISREVKRILRPGGVFRVVVPDAEYVIRMYLQKPQELIAYRGSGDAGETAMEMVNTFFRQRYDHQFLYDWATMEKMLLNAGFDKVSRARFGVPIHLPAITLDDAKYEVESLYVEAMKE
jgi:predicted SAM-dependent methyltransferase